MTPTVALSPPAADRFAIGWRDVFRKLPDGSTVREQIPLTLEDALHPQEGDVIVENSVHNRECRYLHDLLERRYAADPHVVVLGDCKVLWPDEVHHSPDIAVIFDVAVIQESYGQFDTAAEGTRPRLIIELVSPNTRDNDVTTKLDAYHYYGVDYYVIVDRPAEDAEPTLRGYKRTTRRYTALPLDEEGRLWLPPVNLYLGVRDGRVVAYDGDTERELGDYTAVCEERDAERDRADAQQARADALAAELKRLQEQFAKLTPPPS